MGWRYAGATLFVILFMGAIFFAVVFPLLSNSGPLAAEVDGTLPDHAVVNQPLQIDLSIDNTGDRLINPVCVTVDADQPVQLQNVTFQGLESFNFQGNRACGGQLTTQETIWIKIRLIPLKTGALNLTLHATQGNEIISPANTGSIRVS